MNSMTPTARRARCGRSTPTPRTATSSGRRQTVTDAPGPSDSGCRTRASRPARRPVRSRKTAGQEIHLADEIGDEGASPAARRSRRRSDLIDPALAHDDDAVGHRQRLLLVVRHHDGGDAEPPLQVADLAAQARPDARVERRKRLVEEEQAGRQSERAGERDALLLAAGELRRIFLPPGRRGRPASGARRRGRRSPCGSRRTETRP